MLKPALALILAAAPLGAEFLRVEQSVTGLDCLSCAESAPRNLKKIRGVESASFRTADSVAVLELKSGNTVPLMVRRITSRCVSSTIRAPSVPMTSIHVEEKFG